MPRANGWPYSLWAHGVSPPGRRRVHCRPGGYCRTSGYGGIQARLLKPSPTKARGRHLQKRDASTKDHPIKGVASGEDTPREVSTLSKDRLFLPEKTTHVLVTHVNPSTLTGVCQPTEEQRKDLPFLCKGAADRCARKSISQRCPL